MILPSQSNTVWEEVEVRPLQGRARSGYWTSLPVYSAERLGAQLTGVAELLIKPVCMAAEPPPSPAVPKTNFLEFQLSLEHLSGADWEANWAPGPG